MAKLTFMHLRRIELFIEGSYKSHRRWFMIVVCAFLLLVSWQYWATGSRIALEQSGDTDYFLQAHEAIRQTVLEYNQFPWWNPWVGGGVPLFSNPQIGVLSLQTLLTLLFGTVLGLKLSVVIYTLLGFFGVFLLLRNWLKTPILPALLLAFCWSHSGFFAGHLLEHYSFVFFVLFPGLLYLQLRIKEGRLWIIYGIALGLFALSAVHYALVHATLLLGMALAIQLTIDTKLGRMPKLTLIKFTQAALLALLIAGPRIWLTLSYLNDFSRVIGPVANNTPVLLKALFSPTYSLAILRGDTVIGQPHIALEYSANIGLFSAVALTLLLVWFVSNMITKYKANQKRFDTHQVITLLALCFAVIAFFLAKGNFHPLAPYEILSDLPIFSGMQVPSRWLIWCGMGIIVAIGAQLGAVLKKRRNGMYYSVVICLVLAATELGALYAPLKKNDFKRLPVKNSNVPAAIRQVELFDPFAEHNHTTPFNPDSLEVYLRGRSFAFEATLNNFGELRGYEPLFDTRIENKYKCNEQLADCSFIRTRNAEILQWTPNQITIRRTGQGDIILNIAASRYWLANGKRVCGSCKVVSQGLLKISDTSSVITIQSRP